MAISFKKLIYVIYLNYIGKLKPSLTLWEYICELAVYLIIYSKK